MKATRFTEEQIVRALKEVETGGKKAVEQREMGVSNSTWCIWKRKYGGLEVNEAKRLKELEQENNKLKRMVANLIKLGQTSSSTMLNTQKTSRRSL